MKKSEILAALARPDTKVYARVILGRIDDKVMVRTVEQPKAVLVEEIKKLPDHGVFGAHVSRGGHLYISGLKRSEAAALGEPTGVEELA